MVMEAETNHVPISSLVSCSLQLEYCIPQDCEYEDHFKHDHFCSQYLNDYVLLIFSKFEGNVSKFVNGKYFRSF